MLTNAQKVYFAKMVAQMNDNKLQDNEMYQLYEDMAQTGYAWTNPELALHTRMLIEQKCIKAPKNYKHIQVTPEDVKRVQEWRNKNLNQVC